MASWLGSGAVSFFRLHQDNRRTFKEKSVEEDLQENLMSKLTVLPALKGLLRVLLALFWFSLVPLSLPVLCCLVPPFLASLSPSLCRWYSSLVVSWAKFSWFKISIHAFEKCLRNVPLALLLGLHPLAVRLLLPLVWALLNLLEVRLDGKSRLDLL